MRVHSPFGVCRRGFVRHEESMLAAAIYREIVCDPASCEERFGRKFSLPSCATVFVPTISST